MQEQAFSLRIQTHETFNHSRHFKDPFSGAHINTIEGIWSAVKSFMPRYGTMKIHYNGCFAKYI